MIYKAYISVKGLHARCFQDSSLVGYRARQIDTVTNDTAKLSATLFRKVYVTLSFYWQEYEERKLLRNVDDYSPPTT